MSTYGGALEARLRGAGLTRRTIYLIMLMIAVGASLLAVSLRRIELVPWIVWVITLAVAITAEHRLAMPMVILSLPFEVSRLWFPALPVRGELGGGLPPTSIVDLGRVAMGMCILIGSVRPVRKRQMLSVGLPQISVFALVVIYAISTFLSPARQAAMTEFIRLAFFAMFLLVAPALVSDFKAIQWSIIASLVSGIFVAALALVQGVSGSLFWNEGLLTSGQYRVNSVFADPNHMARLLIEVMALGLVALCLQSVRLRVLGLGALLICPPAILLSGSRGGWLIAALILPVTILSLPKPKMSRLTTFVVVTLLVLLIAAAGIVVGSYLLDRLRSFAEIDDLLGPRGYLLRAGIAMFLSHPLFGVGLGAFQQVLQSQYSDLIDPLAGPVTTLSHTALVTIAAELGIIGLIAIKAFLLSWARLLVSTIRWASRDHRCVAIGLAASVLVIVLSGQSAGRFLEDPYLWVLLALMVANYRISTAETAVKQGEHATLLSR